MKDRAAWTEADCKKIETLLGKVSGKHSLHLLAILTLRGEKSFGQLKREMTPISPKVLNDCLAQMQHHGFVTNRKAMKGRVKMSFYEIVDRDKFWQVLVALHAYA